MVSSGAPEVTFITGAGGGIGRSVAYRLAREGKTLVLVGRTLRSLKQTLRSCEGPGLAIAADVRSPSAMRSAIRKAVARFGHVDVLVNIAGVAGIAKSVHNVSLNQWRGIVLANLECCFVPTAQMIPHFLAQERGVIVNVSSILGVIGAHRNSAYATAKAGVIAFTKCVANEYGQYGIRCNCVCPGTIQTRMTNQALADKRRRNAIIARTPLKRVGEPHEVAEVVAFLAGDRAAFMTGSSVIVDGGFSAW